jgi:activator of HSP90 ATPase
MLSTRIPRRSFCRHALALPVGLSAAVRALGADSTTQTAAAGGDGLSRTAEAIHQEIKFGAARQRVFAALTDSQQFDAVTRLSDGLELLKAPGAKPTSISRESGGPFTLFGGYITGRNLELTADALLVQAWRAAGWRNGDYSIAKFSLLEDGGGTQLIFEHRGFPAGTGGHLAQGWHTHYWEPLTQYLAR